MNASHCCVPAAIHLPFFEQRENQLSSLPPISRPGLAATVRDNNQVMVHIFFHILYALLILISAHPSLPRVLGPRSVPLEHYIVSPFLTSKVSALTFICQQTHTCNVRLTDYTSDPLDRRVLVVVHYRYALYTHARPYAGR